MIDNPFKAPSPEEFERRLKALIHKELSYKRMSIELSMEYLGVVISSFADLLYFFYRAQKPHVIREDVDLSAFIDHVTMVLREYIENLEEENG